MRRLLRFAAALAACSFTALALADASASPPPPDKNAIAVTQVGEFTVDLLPRLQSENTISSPYLISSSFALLHDGAGGQTRQQIDKVFHFPKDYEFPLLEEKKADDQKKSAASGVILSMQSTLFVDKGLQLEQDFLDDAAKHFHTTITPVDLNNPHAAADTVNKTVADATHEKINQAVTARRLKESGTNAFVLAETLYFKGTWQIEFDAKATKPAPFLVPGQPPRQVPMMCLKNIYFDYGHFNGVQVLSVPYAGDAYSLMIFLPDDPKGFAALANRPDLDRMQKMLATMKRTCVDLYLPKFSIEDSHDLAKPLAAIGMPDAFSANADFSGMKKSPPGIYLAMAYEKATFAVDEKGTEAASAVIVSGGLFGEAMPPPPPPVPIVFRVDHPCVLVVRENATGMPLFVVGLTSPPAAEKK